jgi:hypothetical protein
MACICKKWGATDAARNRAPIGTRDLACTTVQKNDIFEKLNRDHEFFSLFLGSIFQRDILPNILCRESAMRKIIILMLSVFFVSEPANAIFFFIVFPLPKGNVNPDTVNATLEQRRYSMCAAYHSNVIDPDLSGKKQDSWRGEIMQLANDGVSTFPDFKKLTGIYIRQWQLQSKNSYQAGTDYSRILALSCNKIDLPYDKSQYDNWQLIKKYMPNATGLATLSVDAKPIDLALWFAGASLPKDIKLATLKNSVVHVRTNALGKTSFCELDTSSGNNQLDVLACSVAMEKGRFSPQINGFQLIGSEHDVAVDWGVIYRARGDTLRSPAPVASKKLNDPIFDLAVNRCTKMGHAEESLDYKQCLSTQVGLLSK